MVYWNFIVRIIKNFCFKFLSYIFRILIFKFYTFSVFRKYLFKILSILEVKEVFFFCCFSFCWVGWGLEDWLFEDLGDICGVEVDLFGRGEEGGGGVVVEVVIVVGFFWRNIFIMVEDGVKVWRFVKGLCIVELFGFFKFVRGNLVCMRLEGLVNFKKILLFCFRVMN